MRRRFNFTKRKSIDPERISIYLKRNQQGAPSFEASLDLGGARLPADATVFVEAYYRASYMRFAFGTVGTIIPPLNRELTEFDSGGMVFFRVKVVDQKAAVGKLLAELDDIAPIEAGSQQDNRYCILPVNFTDLGQELWRLKLDDERPVLEVNNIAGMQDFVRSSPMFLSLVYPAVIREVLRQLLVVDDEEFDEDDTTWRGHWLRFCRRFNPNALPGSDMGSERRQEWIDKVVQGFCESYRLREGFVKEMKGSEAA